MKVLWQFLGGLVLGGGIGMLGGFRLGLKKREKLENAAYDQGLHDGYERAFTDSDENAAEEDEKTESKPIDIRSVHEILAEYNGDTDGDDAPEMDMEEPVIDEEEPLPGEEEIDTDDDEDGDDTEFQNDVLSGVRQLHPEDLKPLPVSYEEWSENAEDYEQVYVRFYSYDEVFYRPDIKEVLVDPEELLGIGVQFRFNGNPADPVHDIYIRNDTMGTYYHVEEVENAFCDVEAGMCSPEDE